MGSRPSIDFSSTMTFIFNQQIKSIAAIKNYTLVIQRQRDLSLKFNSPQLHLAAQTLFISRLEKPRAKLLVHLNGRADDLPGDIILPVLGSYRLVDFCQGFSHL